jgi:hypothetical protein
MALAVAGGFGAWLQLCRMLMCMGANRRVGGAQTGGLAVCRLAGWRCANWRVGGVDTGHVNGVRMGGRGGLAWAGEFFFDGRGSIRLISIPLRLNSLIQLVYQIYG